MLLNLWDSCNLTIGFMELYNITAVQMSNIIKRVHENEEQDYIITFCQETGIKLDEVDVFEDLMLVGKIVSTTTDDFKFLKQEGILPIDILLEHHSSPLYQHLKNYQIEIIPSKHQFIYKGKSYYIPSYNQKCEWCIYGDKECKYEKEEKYLNCYYREAIHILSTKIYSDNLGTEMFLYSPKEEMLSYSMVKNYPEIFYTIERFVSSFFKYGLNLGSSWASSKQNTYIISFPVKYNNLYYQNGYIDSCSRNVFEVQDVFDTYKQFCGQDYYNPKQVPKCFWDNVWLISTCINIISFNGTHSDYICAGLKHDHTIPYSDLDIEIVE